MVKDRESVPKEPGCYLLWMGDECVYVGTSDNLYRRVRSHNYRGKFDRVTFEPVDESRRKLREMELIFQYQPRLNKVGWQGFCFSDPLTLNVNSDTRAALAAYASYSSRKLKDVINEALNDFANNVVPARMDEYDYDAQKTAGKGAA